ncbi:MAG TPA: Rieske 2Fe-2S domain-containing protein [Candidatus Binatia bacterium]|nr:Rieske 2Fe-2S domain-containing protein [Candidatus Binatia bacterium]
MLTREENEMLTRVGRGTPAGEMLRRYWMPVACAGELTEEKPIKAFRLLGEDLVVYQDKTRRYGVVAEQCSHRKASLAYGRVDEEGIRCPYHGWKFDRLGRCLEQPAEPAGGFKDKIKHPAYPVERLGGLLWAYLGPEPRPLLPRWDVLVWENGKRWIEKHELYHCNWLQPMENSVDPSHLFWLHGETAHLVGSTSNRYEEEHKFIPFEYGIIKQRRTPGSKPGEPARLDQHPLVFPITLRHVFRTLKTNGLLRHNVQIRVPVDDAHTQVYVVYFTPSETDRSPADGDTPWEYFPIRDEQGEYRLEHVLVQDAMAWETQGAPTDRTQEHLGVGDEGIILLRKILREQIEVVRKGGDPLGVVRDPNKNRLIEFDVINERVGLFGKEQKVA